MFIKRSKDHKKRKDGDKKQMIITAASALEDGGGMQEGKGLPEVGRILSCRTTLLLNEFSLKDCGVMRKME